MWNNWLERWAGKAACTKRKDYNSHLTNVRYMIIMKLDLRHLSSSSILAGAMQGRMTLNKLLERVALEPPEPEIIFLDFCNIQVATVSFLRESVFAFRDIVRSWNLELALTEGISRYGSGSGRGYGFQPLFIGLANLNGSLRFRFGDHALIIDGQKPTLMKAKIAQKPFIPGFFISVRCELEQPPKQGL